MGVAAAAGADFPIAAGQHSHRHGLVPGNRPRDPCDGPEGEEATGYDRNPRVVVPLYDTWAQLALQRCRLVCTTSPPRVLRPLGWHDVRPRVSRVLPRSAGSHR